MPLGFFTSNFVYFVFRARVSQVQVKAALKEQYTLMEGPEGANSHPIITRDEEHPKEQPTETLFTKRAREKEESRRVLSLNTERRRSSGSSNSPKSLPTLKLKTSIHPFKHVSTPKPREHKLNSSRDSRDIQDRPKNTIKRGKSYLDQELAKIGRNQTLITPIYT